MAIMMGINTKILRLINGEKHIAPLAVLRIAFGAVMLFSTIRFIAKGWVYDFYITPKFYFTFYGFDWIKPLPAIAMYVVFVLMAIACLFVMIGLFYKLSITTFFICFVYTELLDKTYYLNHYYFVSLISFLLSLVPAHKYFSVDIIRKPLIKITHVPAWMINIFKWQLCVIYFCAGISKLNHEWMVEAMPLRIWLPAMGDMPVIGALLKQTWVAYLFCWFGTVFDLCIAFLLLYKPTRKIAYVFVIIFHVFTGWLFKIGMFPYIMICVTVIFFSEQFHLRVIGVIRKMFNKQPSFTNESSITLNQSSRKTNLLYSVLAVYVFLQLVLPFRYLLYPDKLYWTEEGYRFSWRVMLMEKSGTAFFYVKDPQTGRRGEVMSSKYLTPLQKRMMETQPDMMLQYAHYLHDVYQTKGIKDPIVTVESYVTLNGSGSRLYIDSTVDLAKQQENFLHKKWILPFK